MFTVWNWIFAGIWFVATILASLFIAWINDWGKVGIIGSFINFCVSLVVLIITMSVIGWYHTSTASGIRDMKDYQSELSNGIDREITITAEDGREIFHYEGKVDVESNHTDNYIKFESEEGKRYIVYYGIQDTIKIIEK